MTGVVLDTSAVSLLMRQDPVAVGRARLTGAGVATANARDFLRIEGLEVEDWSVG